MTPHPACSQCIFSSGAVNHSKLSCTHIKVPFPYSNFISIPFLIKIYISIFMIPPSPFPLPSSANLTLRHFSNLVSYPCGSPSLTPNLISIPGHLLFIHNYFSMTAPSPPFFLHHPHTSLSVSPWSTRPILSPITEFITDPRFIKIGNKENIWSVECVRGSVI